MRIVILALQRTQQETIPGVQILGEALGEWVTGACGVGPEVGRDVVGDPEGFDEV